MRNKKLIAMLTLLCFMFTFMPIAAFAETTDAAPYLKPSAENGTYDAATNTLTITTGGMVNFESNVALVSVSGVRQLKDGETESAGDYITATSTSAYEWYAGIPAKTDETYHFWGNPVDAVGAELDCYIKVVASSTPDNDYTGGGPSYDDSYYDPPPASIPVDVGGNYDAILRDDVVIIRGDDPIAGTLDLTGTDAKAIRLPADALEASTAESHAVTIRFSDDTAATITGSGLAAAERALRDGESLQIAVRPVDAAALPDSLTAQSEDDEPFEDDDGITHYSVFTTEGIFTYDELLGFGVFGGADESISWGDMKLLYQHMTTEDLETLRNRFSGGSKDLMPFVDWLNEMLQRDTFVSPFNMQELMNIANLNDEQFEFLADMELNDPTIGQLKQAGLTLEQMQLLQSNAEELCEGASAKEQAQYDALLDWLEEAIAQKELEASYAQMDSLIEEARSTNGSYTGLNDVKDAAKDMTTEELERFLVKANAAKNSDSGTLPVLALGALDDVIDFLTDELEARQEQEDASSDDDFGGMMTALKILNAKDGSVAPKGSISREEAAEMLKDLILIDNQGEKSIFVSALEADVKAVKVSGSTRNIEILADRSNAVAWSTHVPKLLLDAPTWDTSNVRAYKVLDNGTLEAKAAKVTVNADGTLTLSAMSNGNSTYIFVLEPNPYTDVNENDWYYNDVMLADQQLLMNGTGDNTFSPDAATSRGMIATILHRMEGSPKMIYSGAMTDVPADAYYANAVKWAAATGVLNGYGNGKFGAEDKITREQLAAILHNYAVYKGCDVSVGEDTNILSYNDFDKISEYAISSMQWACGAGVIGGRDGGMLAPQGEAKRCEAAAMLNRYVSWMEETK